MATFRKRSGGWRAEVCVKGIRSSATLTTKREAQAWAAQEESRIIGAEMDTGALILELPVSNLAT